jgi:hypothetical protein
MCALEKNPYTFRLLKLSVNGLEGDQINCDGAQ